MSKTILNRTLTEEESAYLRDMRRLREQRPAVAQALRELVRDLLAGMWREAPERWPQATEWVLGRVKQIEAQAVVS